MYRPAKRCGLLAALLLMAACSQGQQADGPHPPPAPNGPRPAETRQGRERQGGEAPAKPPAAEPDKGPVFRPVNPDTPGPPKDLTPDQLFPAKLDGFARNAHDTKAAMPELGMAFPGRNARYEKDGKQVEVFAYLIKGRDFEALRQPLYDRYGAKQTAALKSVFGGRVGSFWWNLYYRLKEGGEQGIFWCNKDWLVYVRSADLANVGEFFDAYVDGVFMDGHVKGP